MWGRLCPCLTAAFCVSCLGASHAHVHRLPTRNRRSRVCLTAGISSVGKHVHVVPRLGKVIDVRLKIPRRCARAVDMDSPLPSHGRPGGWLVLPSVGRIASFTLLVLVLLLFYEQVKMFLYRHAFLSTW